MGEKPWQLTGEIAGPARPENSLLQEHLEYDTAGRQAPVITEEVRAACPSTSGSRKSATFADLILISLSLFSCKYSNYRIL